MARIVHAWWDATPNQVLGSYDLEITPASLKEAGYKYISGDCESVENSCIWLWRNRNQKRWYLCLFAGDEKVASALVFNSGALADVIREFEVIGGVL